MPALVVLLFLSAQAAPSSAASAPGFEDFHVAEVFHAQPAAPRFATPGQRKFRSMIRDAARNGANFAGHYAIAEWGCGAGCISMAVIDLQSGAVYDGPFGQLPHSSLDVSQLPADASGLSYRADSRLLITRGCPASKNCAEYFWEWTGAQFRLLRRNPIPKPGDSGR